MDLGKEAINNAVAMAIQLHGPEAVKEHLLMILTDMEPETPAQDEADLLRWLKDAEQTVSGTRHVPISEFTARFGPLRGPFLDQIVQMSHDRLVDLAGYDSWRQKVQNDGWHEGVQYINLNNWRRGMGFINASRR